MKFIDLEGMKFERWTVLSISGRDSKGAVKWLCKCECGTTREITSYSLRDGVSKSCGCLRDELSTIRNLTHGHSRRKKRSPEYRAWAAMIKRCYNVNVDGYQNYGGRGIGVCDRWRNSYELFLADMGDRPTPDFSLDRINVNGNYEPSNCRWANKSEQAYNQRMKKNNTSGVKGVYWHSKDKRWVPTISHNKKPIYLGSFKNKEDAIKTRKEAEEKYWGKSS